ncbi:MAG: hypothetical protein RRY40_00735, partial [Oscillospiraceae bacterium]
MNQKTKSLFLRIVVYAAAGVTLGILIMLTGYILIK